MKPIIRFIEENRLESLTYADFIKLALYHPEFGYYMKNHPKFGAGGDFYTSATMSPIFAAIIARWFLKQVKKHDLPAMVVEMGAGDGSFADAFINEWEQITDEPLTYQLVDESVYHRNRQQERLSKYKRTNLLFQYSMDECHSFSGLVFSNEFLDALPVHVIERKEGQLFEVMITVFDGKLQEVLVPLENVEIDSYVQQMAIDLSDGQRIEIPLLMTRASAAISTRLEKGLVLTADYGYTDKEWLMPTRKDGSMRGYREHRLTTHILESPAVMDITHDVHWDSWIRFGEKNGLSFKQKWRQDEFLLASGILDELSNHSGDIFSKEAKKNRAIRTLLMDSGISQSLQLVLQEKNI